MCGRHVVIRRRGVLGAAVLGRNRIPQGLAGAPAELAEDTRVLFLAKGWVQDSELETPPSA